MSHFTRVKTQMVEKEFIVKALEDLGYAYEEGSVEIRGYGGNRDRVEIRVPTSNRGYDIGFRKAGKVYEMVADWWGIRDIKQEHFVQQLMQRYSYHTARTKLEEQGFLLVTEENQQDGRIHLVLRRMA
jgi:uncharacterized protein DUF1257